MIYMYIQSFLYLLLFASVLHFFLVLIQLYNIYRMGYIGHKNSLLIDLKLGEYLVVLVGGLQLCWGPCGFAFDGHFLSIYLNCLFCGINCDMTILNIVGL